MAGNHRIFESLAQRGCLHQRGRTPVWYATVSDNMLKPDGSEKRMKRKIRLGLVSQITEEEARQMMAQIVGRINARSTPTNLTTLRRFIDNHFKPEVVRHLKKAGRSHYGWVLDRQIAPALADMRLSEISLVHLQRLINLKLDTGLSVQTVKHIKGGLSAIFRHALALRVIEGFNPAAGIRFRRWFEKSVTRRRPRKHEPSSNFCASLSTRHCGKWSSCRARRLCTTPK